MNEHRTSLKNAAVALLMANALAILLLALAASGGPNSLTPPPIITLSEAEGFTFPVGTAAISPLFAESLQAAIGPRIAEIARRYRCDVIEVIGHTDGQPVLSESNLDRQLMTAVGEDTTGGLRPGSNADLGLMRAWAVALALGEQEALANFQIAAYSAGQVLKADGTYASNDDFADTPDRRRIEIRVRRSSNNTSVP